MTQRLAAASALALFPRRRRITMQNMRSMALTALREMRMIEVPEPEIRDRGDVLLAVNTVGVCGSDVHYYTTGRIGTQVVQFPFCVGHEFAATVLEVGEGVARVSPGDRVAVDPAMSCGNCDQCRAGRRHTCRTLKFLGCPGQVEGCLGERIVMPEACCYRVADATTFELAALVEPLSIGVYAVRMSVPAKSARIGILGCGPIGLSVLLAAADAGAERIYCTDKIDARLHVAKKAGASWTGNPCRTDVVEEIAARESALLDVVFECCGEQEALDQAVDLVKPGGKVMLVGIPEIDRVSFAIEKLRRKEICLQNVRRQNECVGQAIDMIETGGLRPGFMVTHRFPLERAQEAFDLVAGYADGVVKAMIQVQGEDPAPRT